MSGPFAADHYNKTAGGLTGRGRSIHLVARRKTMSHDTKSASTDLVRWSFTINAAHRGAIEGHLADLGADILVRDGLEFIVTWDEPEGDLTDVIEAIWALNGEPFEVIQEGFHRLELHTIHHVEDDSNQEAA
jgi:hypothetical protein